MNYLYIYRQLIARAKSENRQKLNRNDSNYIYYESHHIIPRCLLKHKPKHIVNGKWNLVLLTAREHFIAHALLWKISKQRYGINHNRTHKMIYALLQFSRKLPNRTKINSNTYKILKENHSCVCSLRQVSDTTRKLLSKKFSGKNNPIYGTKRSKEVCDKISKTLSGRKVSDETKNKLRERSNYHCKTKVSYKGITYDSKQQLYEKTGLKRSECDKLISQGEITILKHASGSKKISNTRKQLDFSNTKYCKYMYTIIYKNNKHITVKNLKQFARENNYISKHLYEMITNENKTYCDIINVSRQRIH